MANKCPVCGAAVHGKSPYCKACGTPLEKPAWKKRQIAMIVGVLVIAAEGRNRGSFRGDG